MQLNPARGRKPGHSSHRTVRQGGLVYAAQPREGTETQHSRYGIWCPHAIGLCSSTPRGDGNASRSCHSHVTSTVYAAQPREGTETEAQLILNARDWQGFMQLNPARGRKLFDNAVSACRVCLLGLCSSTPRGDGNDHYPRHEWQDSLRKVYAAQPREGTETYMRPDFLMTSHGPGLCSSTPRGDGNVYRLRSSATTPHGLCSSTPRGDGNSPRTSPSWRLRHMSVYAAQPREGTETRG